MYAILRVLPALGVILTVIVAIAAVAHVFADRLLTKQEQR